MILVLMGICALALALSLVIAATEALTERDWPRDTGWYPVAFLLAFVFLISAV
jgi:hypothetical protein